jgi:hypothetical protein
MAGMQLQQGMEAALAGQLAAQSSVRGRANIGMGLRGSMQNMAAMQQNAAMEAAKMRVQEQFNAQQNLAGLSSSMRSSDLGAAGLQANVGLANMAAQNQFGLAQGQMDLQTQLANQNAANQFAITQGQMNQQVNLANAQMQLQKMGLDDQTIANLLGMSMKQSEADRNAMMQFEQDKTKSALEWEKMNYENNATAASNRGKLVSGIAQMFTSLSDERQKTNIRSADQQYQDFMNQTYKAKGLAEALAEEEEKPAPQPANTQPDMGNMASMAGMFSSMSDEELKGNIHPADPRVRQFMRGIGAHSYEYKSPNAPGAGHGTFVSPMAQELEKTDLGKSMVVDTPHGKMVDYGKGFGVILAGSANHESRISDLEAALKASIKRKK